MGLPSMFEEGKVESVDPAHKPPFFTGVQNAPGRLHSQIKTEAYKYWSQGLNIVLVKAKKPVHEWQNWQNERQSQYDFDILPWEQADGFALIGGSKLKNGLYLCAVDYDIKNVDEEAKEIGKKILKKLPITQIEETPSGGQHWIYYSRVKPKSISAYHNECALELLGEGKLIIMALSPGYKRLNDNTPTVVENLEDIFLKALSNTGIKTKDQASRVAFWFNREDLAGKPYRKKHPTCIAKLLSGVTEGIRNETAIRLTSYLVNFRRLKPKKVWDILLEWNSQNQPPLKEKELKSIFESALKHGYVFGCNDSILSSQCTNKAECPIGIKTLTPLETVEYELEKRSAIILHPLIDYHPETGFSIGVLLGDHSQSLIFLEEKPFITDFGSFEIKEKFAKSISMKQPKFASLSPTHFEQILLLSRDYFKNEKIEFPAKNEVFEKVMGEVKRYWWISDNRYYIAVTCWIIGTYFHPIFAYYPILALQGLRETGKTTLLDLLRKMCWNPTGREVALREADLFRTIEDSRVTYLADITRLNPKSKDYRDVIDVYETGTEKGGCVRRIDQDTKEPINYMTFGPKAIATRYDLPFTPKCIQIITEKAPNKEYSAKRAKLEFDPVWSDVVGSLIKGAIKYWKEILEAYASVEQTERLVGRAFNYWAPILAVCRVFAPQHYEDLLSLAEEEAERMEKGDILSDVEEAVLIVLLEEAQKTKQDTITILLKELTEKASEICPLIQNWQTVKNAVKNLKILKRKYQQSGKGVVFQLDLKRAKAVAEERGIGLEQTPKTIETFSLDDLKAVYWSDDFFGKHVCGVCGYEHHTSWQAETMKGAEIAICEECKDEFFKRRESAD
jgi:hypothetical protein